MIAPAIAIVGLACGMYPLMSRFGLLAGTTAEGVDPSTHAWGLSTLGWFLVALPFLSFVGGGAAIGAIRRRSENENRSG